MAKKHINLTDAEWSVMECLWDYSPRTGREVVQYMEETASWSRSTTLTMLSRLETKGAVTSDSDGDVKRFRAALLREDAAMHETEDFLSRVYQGSLSLLVSAMTRKKTLSQQEIRELSAMLKELEGGEEDA